MNRKITIIGVALSAVLAVSACAGGENNAGDTGTAAGTAGTTAGAVGTDTGIGATGTGVTAGATGAARTGATTSPTRRP